MKQTPFFAAAMGSLLGATGAFGIFLQLNAAEPGVAASTNAVADTGGGVPVIQFETNRCDFGKIIAPGELSGVFKFKNTGTGVLKVDRPAPSCNCTESKVVPDTVAPGQSGQVIYTISLEHAFRGQKTIKVHSNDPKTPDVQLVMEMDYKPLYEVVPKALRITVAVGKDSAEGSFTVMRTDGQPLQIDRLTTSQNWLSASLDAARNPLEESAKVNVVVRRPAQPSALMSANVQLWAPNQTNRPMQTVMVIGDMQGELVAAPSKLYWVIPDLGDAITNYPADSLSRKIELTSVLGKPVQIKNASTSIKGLGVQVVPKDGGKAYDLMLKFDKVPKEFANGKVMVETSMASLPKVEIPLTVAVPSGK